MPPTHLLKSIIESLDAVTPPIAFRRGIELTDATLPDSLVLWAGKRMMADSTRLNDRFTLVISLNAHATIMLERAPMRLKPNLGVLVFPHQHHNYMDFADSPDDPADEGKWLLASFGMKQPGDIHILRNLPIQITPDNLRVMARLARCYSQSRGRLYANHEALFWLAGLLTQFKTQAMGQVLPIEAPQHEQLVHQVSAYVHTHLHEPFRLEDIADHVSLSESHLRLLFRKATGRSLGEFVIAERIARSIHLLLYTEMSLQEIARSCGFRSASVFARNFRQHTGFSPRAYARQALAKRPPARRSR